MSQRLTDEERRAVFDATPLYPYEAPRLISAVERIVAARLAAVEALADEWEAEYEWKGDSRLALVHAAARLRAAVAAVSSEAPAQPWAGPVAALREGRVRPGLPARPNPDSSEAPA
jgi:hypothetical protein